MTSPQPPEPPIARNASLDAARGILMMMGVLLHAANIYSTEGGWLVWDSERHRFFDLLAEVVHVFRMPAFFWVSGYFCAMTFFRNGSQGLLRKRLPRLAIPLLSAWLLLNTAQIALMALIEHRSVIDALGAGVPLFHLWFLVDLLVYMTLAALLLPLAQRLPNWTSSLLATPLWLLLPLCALLSMAFSVGSRLTGHAYADILGLTSLYRLATYAPYFVVGIAMYRHSAGRGNFLASPVWLLALALPIALIANDYTQHSSRLASEGALYVHYLMVWLSVASILRLFHAIFKRDNAVTRFLSDSAYTIYLFHHILVAMLGTALLGVATNAWLKFALVACLSFSASALLHALLIRRQPLLRKMFNGK